MIDRLKRSVHTHKLAYFEAPAAPPDPFLATLNHTLLGKPKQILGIPIPRALQTKLP
jgi:hypothetical protein